ncbi:substance-K receptor-like [Orbicella faveolata]|uniref:substance-K receptor-like n=1 Tax=Orbicella faveolata TaxID=48498 RepID=UPI0009E37507|nr:substance-K receptor-like [Orbicella faveolata]
MSQDLNKTMNGTQPSKCYWNPTAEKIGITFVSCLIFLVSLAGNTVIGIIAYKTKTMRKPINFLIVNMAMSDLLFPSFLVPWDIQQLYINSWLIGGPLGQVLCKLTYYLPYVSMAVSVQSLVLIAVDRFGVVVYPLRSPLISSKLCPFFILATWIVSLAFLSPYLFALKLVEYSGGLVCTLHWKEAFGESSSFENYFVSWLVTFVFIPLLLIATLYITTYVKLKSQKIPGEQSANAGQQRQQRESNVLKMAIAIVLGFAVCWLPFAIRLLLFHFVSDIISSCGFQYFSFVASFMARTNCAMNPCICFIFSRNYRKGLKTLFR